MGRPIDADAAATRRRILEEAGALFAEEGHAKGSIRAIAGRAGVSLAMVHHYFGSKDGLYEACVDAMHEELAELQEELTTSLRDASKRQGAGEHPCERQRSVLEGAVRTLYRFACEHRSAVRLMLRTVVETGQLGNDRRERALLPFLDGASALLAPIVGTAPRELRLPLQSLVFLTARYAIAATEELVLVASTEDGVSATQAVEDHLVNAALGMLGLTPASREPSHDAVSTETIRSKKGRRVVR